ncbi:hypothetical protein PO124_30090 [Bacillus licheniformis]|nr:hypothetical protein [Bacillus licheniformis]
MNELLDFIYLFLKRESGRHDSPFAFPHLSAVVFGAFVHIQKLVRAGEFEDPTELMEEIEECSWDAVKHHG